MDKETINNFIEQVKDVPIIYKILIFVGFCIVILSGFIGAVVGYEVWISKKTGKPFQFFSLFKIPSSYANMLKTPVNGDPTPVVATTPKEYNKYGNLELTTTDSVTMDTDKECQEKCDSSSTCQGYYYDTVNKKCETFDKLTGKTVNPAIPVETAPVHLMYLVTPKDRVSLTKWIKLEDAEIDTTKNASLTSFMSFKSSDTVDNDSHVKKCKNLCRDVPGCTGFSANQTLNTCNLYNNFESDTPIENVSKSSTSLNIYVLNTDPDATESEVVNVFGTTNGTVTNVTNGTVTNGTNGTVTNGTNGTVTNGTNGTVTNGTNGTVTNGTVTNGTNGTVTNGTNGTVTNGTNGTVTNGTNGTVTNGTNGTVTNGTVTNGTNGTNGTVTNGTNGTVTNGTNGTVTNGTV
jgi:hypothetical protein